MKEIFVIERLVLDGIWEIAIPTFYTDERTAVNECFDMIEKMRKVNTTFCARIKKLTHFNPKTIMDKLEWEYTGYDYQIPNIQDKYLYIGDWRIKISDLEKTIPE